MEFSIKYIIHNRKFLAGPMNSTHKDSTLKAAASRPPAKGAAPKGKPVGATINTVTILRYLSRRPSPTRLADIARDLRMNPSNCLNILHTLVGEEFVAFDPDSKRYEIGVGVLELSHGSGALQRDITAVRPLLERVATNRGVTVALWRPISREQKVLVLAASGPGQTRIHLGMGQRPPLLSGSGGRVIAAFGGMKEGALRVQFKKLRWAKPISFEQFMQQAAETRQRGWGVDVENLLTGVAAVGVPVFDTQGALFMVCTAIMWVNQFNERFAQDLASDLLQLSRNITFISPTL
jgi:DNA-binding IclR family transcriptional regulator